MYVQRRKKKNLQKKLAGKSIQSRWWGRGLSFHCQQQCVSVGKQFLKLDQSEKSAVQHFFHPKQSVKNFNIGRPSELLTLFTLALLELLNVDTFSLCDSLNTYGNYGALLILLLLWDTVDLFCTIDILATICIFDLARMMRRMMRRMRRMRRARRGWRRGCWRLMWSAQSWQPAPTVTPPPPAMQRNYPPLSWAICTLHRKSKSEVQVHTLHNISDTVSHPPWCCCCCGCSLNIVQITNTSTQFAVHTYCDGGVHTSAHCKCSHKTDSQQVHSVHSAVHSGVHSGQCGAICRCWSGDTRRPHSSRHLTAMHPPISFPSS